MRKSIVLCCVALTLVGSLSAQQTSSAAGGARSTDAQKDNCGLLYGKNHSLLFCAPDGWHLDNGILNEEGIYAVFYPTGSSWDRARTTGTFMYINVISR